MRIDRKALLALLTAMTAVACGTAQDFADASAHSNAYGCDSCHGYPPPPAFPIAQQLHPQGVTATQCTICHPGTVLADGHSIVSGGEHRDGQIQYRPFAELSCSDCHGAPPTTGSHMFHVTNLGLACETCHKGYLLADKVADPNVHMNGTADVVLEDGTVIPTVNNPDHTWPGTECTACHTALAN